MHKVGNSKATRVHSGICLPVLKSHCAPASLFCVLAASLPCLHSRHSLSTLTQVNIQNTPLCTFFLHYQRLSISAPTKLWHSSLQLGVWVVPNPLPVYTGRSQHIPFLPFAYLSPLPPQQHSFMLTPSLPRLIPFLPLNHPEPALGLCICCSTV